MRRRPRTGSAQGPLRVELNPDVVDEQGDLSELAVLAMMTVGSWQG
jgi:hypothetical protein